jgi:hypothetical protein
MKIARIGRNLINLDKIIMFSEEDNVLILEENIRIQLNGTEVEDFIFNYNMYDTDETTLLLRRLARAVLSNPEYLTKEGMIEQITIIAKMKDKEKKVKELTEGKKLKDLSVSKLGEIYKNLLEEIKTMEAESPY